MTEERTVQVIPQEGDAQTIRLEELGSPETNTAILVQVGIHLDRPGEFEGYQVQKVEGGYVVHKSPVYG